MNRIITCAIIATAILTGCSTDSPMRLKSMSAAELANETTFNLCRSYQFSWRGNSPVKAELQRRALFDDRTWKLIDSGQVVIGMSSDAVVCSWGGYYDVKRTAVAGDVRELWNYGNGRVVYLMNGIVDGVEQ